METPVTMDDLGVTPFQDTPTSTASYQADLGVHSRSLLSDLPSSIRTIKCVVLGSTEEFPVN